MEPVNMNMLDPLDQSQRGFAAMDPDRQREIASEGGHAAQTRGTAHRLTETERSRGGKAGGQTTAQDRQHMAEIGSKGGHAAQSRGTAHRLTDEERSRGGQRSRGGRAAQQAREQQAREQQQQALYAQQQQQQQQQAAAAAQQAHYLQAQQLQDSLYGVYNLHSGEGSNE